jgi:TPR repeat protein
MIFIDNSASPLIARSVQRFLLERSPSTARAEKPGQSSGSSLAARLLAHPALPLACPDAEFVAELNALPAYCLASRFSMRRWEAGFLPQRCVAGIHLGLLLREQRRIHLGLPQRRAVLTRGGMCELLALRLLRVRGEYCVRHNPLRAAICIVSQRHFLVARDRAESLFRDGLRLHGEQRYSEAARCWGQAALLLHGPSHAFLSSMLIEGRRDVIVDENLALKLARAGEALGCAHSKGMLGRCYSMRLVSVPDASAKGFAACQQSAAAGSFFGQSFLANFYCNHGVMVQQDDAEAVRLYRLAADQGFAGAQKNLGVMLSKGRGVAKDDAEAVRLYRLAAAQGHVQAHWHLGGSLYVGRGAEQDRAEGIRLMRIAALHGSEEAIAKLNHIESKSRGEIGAKRPVQN